MAKKATFEKTPAVIPLLSGDELLRLAEKHNSGGRFGNLKETLAALNQYNRYLKGEIELSELWQ